MAEQGVTRRQVVGAAAAAGAVAAVAAPAVAQAQGGPVSVASVSLDQAQKVLRAAERRARQIGVPMYVVVVDAAGVEKAVLRMDGNGPASPALAPAKARTANAFRTPTHVLAQGVAGDPARLASIVGAGFSLLGGGVPLRAGSAVIGAVGAGGGSPEQDADVAGAGAAAIA